MLVFELKLIEELQLLALEQLADVKHFKLLRLECNPALWHFTDTCGYFITNTNIED
uniref:Uncharacterized protein n=1 Tax=Utricularia reniformis TaxID=192314 RepID=A0A1Y0B4D2_9LAMI|nr:hypothetical protein AEK19_MT2120 [Utricularia reniformis]ART32272.1 hypothetical protein AEK19_MT2120 [Utricularia reniformis]